MRRGAQLDGDFAFYASRLRLPKFGPGSEAAAGRGVCFLRLPPPTLGLARRGGGRAAGRGVCFLRLPPSTSGLVRRGRRRGALPWPGVCFSIFHSPASRREAQLCSVTGPNTI